MKQKTETNCLNWKLSHCMLKYYSRVTPRRQSLIVLINMSVCGSLWHCSQNTPEVGGQLGAAQLWCCPAEAGALLCCGWPSVLLSHLQWLTSDFLWHALPSEWVWALGIHIPVVYFMRLWCLPCRDRGTEMYRTVEEVMVFIMAVKYTLLFRIWKLLSVSVLCSVDGIFCSSHLQENRFL